VGALGAPAARGVAGGRPAPGGRGAVRRARAGPSYRDPGLQRYTAFGDTCAGRQPAGTLRLCTASFPR